MNDGVAARELADDDLYRIAIDAEAAAHRDGWDQRPTLLYVRPAGSSYRLNAAPHRLADNFPENLIGAHAPAGTCALVVVTEGWRFPDHDLDGTAVGALQPSQHPDRVELRFATVISASGRTLAVSRDRGGPAPTAPQITDSINVTGRIPTIARRFMRLDSPPLNIGELTARALLGTVHHLLSTGVWPADGGDLAVCRADTATKLLFIHAVVEDAVHADPAFVTVLDRAAVHADTTSLQILDGTVDRWLTGLLADAANGGDWLTADLFASVPTDRYLIVKQAFAADLRNVDWWGIDDALRDSMSHRATVVCDMLAGADPTAARRLRRVVISRLTHDGLSPAALG
jgi:hypothetical protein